jgi:hypothetical protein
MTADYTTDVTVDLGLQPAVSNWGPGQSQIDTLAIAPNLFATTYRETDVVADPASPPGYAPVDPLLGLATLGAELREFLELLGYVLTELQARSDLLKDSPAVLA